MRLALAAVCVVAAVFAACSGTSSSPGDDAGVDATHDAPTAFPDASFDVGTTCGPLDVSGYQPQPLTPPNPPHANKCTSQQISDYAQCQGAKINSYCTEFADGQPGQPCRECIETQSTAMRWGVIVFTGSNGSFNIEGCVDDALSEVSEEKSNGGTGSCGDLLFASYGCQSAACGACKGETFATCANAAVADGCKTYDSAVESKSSPCAALFSDAAPADASACFPDTSITDSTDREVDWLTRMVGYMCGP